MQSQQPHSRSGLDPMVIPGLTRNLTALSIRRDCRAPIDARNNGKVVSDLDTTTSYEIIVAIKVLNKESIQIPSPTSPTPLMIEFQCKTFIFQHCRCEIFYSPGFKPWVRISNIELVLAAFLPFCKNDDKTKIKINQIKLLNIKDYHNGKVVCDKSLTVKDKIEMPLVIGCIIQRDCRAPVVAINDGNGSRHIVKNPFKRQCEEILVVQRAED